MNLKIIVIVILLLFIAYQNSDYIHNFVENIDSNLSNKLIGNWKGDFIGMSFYSDGTGLVQPNIFDVEITRPMKYKMLGNDTLELIVLAPSGKEEITKAKYRFIGNGDILIMEISGISQTLKRI